VDILIFCCGAIPFSLSLSLFEALRGLRDSVAPESTNNNGNVDEGNENPNIGGSGSTIPRKSPIDFDMDYDDFLLAYNRDDPVAIEFIAMADNKPPKTRDEYTKLRAKFAIKRASELMSRLSDNILNKSAAVHDLVASLPNRTKAEQMQRISELIEENKKAEEGLQEAYVQAEMRRNKLRTVLDEVTCKSLGILEES